MTSGQHGGEPDQPPEEWGSAPGRGPEPGWNPPPRADQPPYGSAPGWGYAPAPSAAWGWGAPTPMERPTTVRAGLGAFVASIVLGLVSSVVTFLNWDTVVDRALADARARFGTGPEAEAAVAGVEIGARVGAVIGLLAFAAYLLFVWFAWQGHNWARIVLWVLGGLGVVFTLAGLAIGRSPLPFLTALSTFQLLLTCAGIVLLALKPSNDWYRYRGWQRAAGQIR